MASTTAAALPPNIFDPSAAPQHGARATESAHRKIELQHPADWTYLLANATDAAREKISRHFPLTSTGAGGASTTTTTTIEGEHAQPLANAATKKLPGDKSVDGEVRERVVELVDEVGLLFPLFEPVDLPQYLRATYDAAKSSVVINGMDMQEMETELAKYHDGAELEPFDAKLAQRIQDLSAQVEQQTLALANLRRKAPQETARKFRDSFDARSALYDEHVQAQEKKQIEAAKATTVNVGPVPRAGEMQQAYQQGTDGLHALKTGLGGAVARMEKARSAVEVLEE